MRKHKLPDLKHQNHKNYHTFHKEPNYKEFFVQII